MIHLRSLASVFVASLAIFLAATTASADVLLTDTLSRAARTSAPTATGAQWFSIGPGLTVTYAPNDLKLTHASGNGGQLLGHVTTAATPVNLAVGESLKATFTFSLVGGLGATTGDTAIRVGLFNTGAQRITADITTASSSGLFTNYTGYAAMFSPTTAGSSIRRRIPAAGTNQTNLIGTANNVYSAPLASGSSQTLQSNVDYTGVLTASRSATGIEFKLALAGGSLSSYELAYTDTSASAVLTFDAIAFGWSNAVVQAGGGLAVRTLTLERGSVGAINPTDPLANPDPGRPFVWVRDSEKTAILAKIGAQPWAQGVRNAMISRVATNVASHQSDRDAFLRQLPVNWSDPIPNFKTMLNTSPQSEVRTPAVAKFNLGLDCAVLYYLTGETKYAHCAADILHNVVKTLLPVAPDPDLVNGGWIVRNDLLLEARILGTHLPIIYDFLRPFLESNQVWDVPSGALADFNYYQAQAVFRTYYRLVRDHGSANSNWSALMATCMLNNLLALADPAERAAALTVYLTTGSSRQASLNYDYRHYVEPGNIWPESLQYAGDVVSIRSTHLVLLERYDPTLDLVGQYPNYPLSLSRISYLRYPNGQQISFGDGPRKTGGEPYFEYEVIYQHAKARGRQDLVDHFGAAIQRGVAGGQHNRSAVASYEALGMHNEPVQLLWFAADVSEAAVPQVLPTTDRLPFAGIALQRNPSPQGPLYGLMGFVGGAGHIHSHASGMSMELYGAGQVLGAKSGKGTYLSTLHENYYRLFASNNTIIVNGASRGQTGWEDIGINTVGTAALEPAVAQAPVSPNHSFTTSTFSDNRGSGAEATQQRTLGIIRTSPTTGYYVDLFRSDSSLANEYHDYIYRNVGDGVTLATDTGPLALTSAPNRFASDIGDTYKQPGWRYFTNTEVSAATADTVRVDFSATLPAGPTQMRMHMAGSSGREYARVMSPSIVDAPSPYHTRLAPAVVIRSSGSAWNQPFAAVFEPHLGAPGSGSVKTVAKLEKNGVVVGLQVGSTVGERNLIQYVLSNPNPTDVYEDPVRGLSFTGRYAVVTDHGDGSGSLYLGEGSSLAFKGNTVTSANGANTQAYVEFAPGQSPVVKSNSPVIVLTPPTITVPASATGTYGAAFTVSVTATGQPAPVLTVASTLPPGLQFNAATGTLTGTPTAAGNYTVQFVATNSAGSATGTLALSIARAPAIVSLQNLVQTYTGQPLAPTVVAVPASGSATPATLAYAVTYDGSPTAPTNAGTYTVDATVTELNYAGSVTGSLTIEKAVAPVVLSNLNQTYDASPKSVATATTPAGLTVNVTYDSSPVAPTDAGSYAVVASIANTNYRGSSSATLVIAPATASLTLGGLAQRYDGTPKSVTTTTTPTGLAVNVTYNGSATAPSAPGTYAVVATTTAPNYTGTADGTLVISTAVLVRHAPTLNGGLAGSLQVLLPESTTLNGNAYVSGDLLVPGTPTVQLNGRPTYGSTLDGNGATSPANYSITLNGTALLRHVVRRTDAAPMPTVAAPPAPTGTRTVSLNSATDSAGDFATLRNLTLNGNAGTRAVPPGTYGTFTVNGNSGLVLGIAGATTPAIYNLQGLTLNANTALQIVGPVVLNLAGGVSVNSSVGSATDPEWLTVNLASGGFTLNGNTTVHGSVVAPSGTVIINGNSTLRGAVTADRLTINGNGLLDSTP